jgi:thymidylate synthase (FAD)
MNKTWWIFCMSSIKGKQMLKGGYVHYISHHGSDLAVVNAARVSLGKWKDELDKDDIRLIGYLARNRHTSPFRHCSVTMRIRMPIFVERQFTKHRFGVEINSISGRYVEFKEEYYIPETFRKGSASIKQGSLDEPVKDELLAQLLYLDSCKRAFRTYNELLELGVCKEQARTVLPLSLWTECICTMSLQAASHFYGLRADAHAQREIQAYAHAIGAIFMYCYPHAWNALQENK